MPRERKAAAGVLVHITDQRTLPGLDDGQLEILPIISVPRPSRAGPQRRALRSHLEPALAWRLGVMPQPFGVALSDELRQGRAMPLMVPARRLRP